MKNVTMLRSKLLFQIRGFPHVTPSDRRSPSTEAGALRSSAPALLSAAVESLLVTYVYVQTVRCLPNTRPSLGPLCRPAI